MNRPSAANRVRRSCWALAAALAATALAGAADAQTKGSFSLDQFEPAPVGDRFFDVEGFDVGPHLQYDFGVLAEYARNPLVLYEVANGAVTATRASLVSDQLFLHLQANLSLFERVGISADFPLALLNQGSDTSGFTAPSGVAPGDLRMGVRVRVFGREDSVIGGAFNGYVWIPTGNQAEFAGAGSVRGSPGVAVGGRISNFLWGANGSVLLQPEPTFQNTELGHELTFGGGVAVTAVEDRFQFGPELYGDTAMVGKDAFTINTTNLELLAGAKMRFGPIVVGLGGGPGLTRGLGTPAARAVLSVAYVPTGKDRDGDGIPDSDDACPDDAGPRNADLTKNGCPDRDGDGIIDRDDACPDTPGVKSEDKKFNGCPDTDKDGIFNVVDACPKVPGVKSDDPAKNGCPPVADRDGDGIADDKDACPDVKGIADPDPKKNGCPPDRDGDGIPDAEDACPDVKGVKSPDPKKNGCPLDTDGDGILDDKDACPNDPGPPDPDPRKNGCPKAVIREGRIEILEQVQFKTGSDVILAGSDDLLTKVSAILRDHAEITRVLVEGHTDNQGGKAMNQGLSERRAASVKRWLVTRGKIDAKRLDSKGFGMDKPIADNTTAEGRQKNRRVEFKIVTTAKPTNVAPKK